HAAARRFARAVAGATEHAGKHVGTPVDHVGVGVAPGGDQPDIFGNGRVSRTSPLTIDDFMEVVRRGNIGILHSLPRNALSRGDTRDGKFRRWRLALPAGIGLCWRRRIRRPFYGVGAANAMVSRPMPALYQPQVNVRLFRSSKAAAR